MGKRGDEQIQFNNGLKDRFAITSKAHQKHIKSLQSDLEAVQRQLVSSQTTYTAKSSEAMSARLARNRAIDGLRALTKEAERFNVSIPHSSKRSSLLAINTSQSNTARTMGNSRGRSNMIIPDERD